MGLSFFEVAHIGPAFLGCKSPLAVKEAIAKVAFIDITIRKGYLALAVQLIGLDIAMIGNIAIIQGQGLLNRHAAGKKGQGADKNKA